MDRRFGLKLAQIEGDTVVNIIVVDPNAIPEWANDWPESTEAGPGWAYVGGVFSPPEEEDN